jgi:hypothetical protein
MFFHKGSRMQSSVVATSSQSELVVTTTEKLEPIKGGIELAIVSCTSHLPTKPMEVPIVVISI